MNSKNAELEKERIGQYQPSKENLERDRGNLVVAEILADAKNRAVNTDQKRSYPVNVDLEKVK